MVVVIFFEGEYTADNKDVKATFIDTHCHLEYIFQKRKINGGYVEFLQKHRMPHNFEGCISNFCDAAAFSSLGLWEDLLQNNQIWGAFGLHPHNAKYYTDVLVERIVKCLQHPRAVAWGEMGLDYHYNHSAQQQQKDVFISQAKKAVELKKPIVVHSREADNDTFAILKQNVPGDWAIHMHCFDGDTTQAIRLLKDFSNLYIGVTGVLTFTNAENLRSVVRDIIPLDRLLLETDGPYLTPKPYKGVCHPGFIPCVASQVAKLKNVTLEETYTVIRDNTKKMYKI